MYTSIWSQIPPHFIIIVHIYNKSTLCSHKSDAKQSTELVSFLVSLKSSGHFRYENRTGRSVSLLLVVEVLLLLSSL